MPVHVEHRGESSRPWKIVETATGRIRGSSTSKRNAEISASRRNQAHKAKSRGRKK